MSHSTGLWHKIQLYLHVIVWSCVLTAAGIWLTVYLIGTLGDPRTKKPAQTTADAEFNNFDSIMALTEKKVERHLGEWEFSEPHIPSHFHHIGRWYETDTWSFCIDCHGPIPHSRSPQVRAFLNMHDLFITCRTCHVREENESQPARFGWLSLSDGKLTANPDMREGVWGEYGAKIVPLAGPGDNPQPVTLDEEERFALEFQKRRDNLSNQQKVVGNKFIHRGCSDTPLRCRECHTAQDALLSFTELGYSPGRAAFLVSVEVVDLVQRYEEFYLPTLLKPGAKLRGATKEEDE